MAVGRMLLENVTTESFTDQLSHNKQVVCVAMIQDGNDRIVQHRCCGIKKPRTNKQKGPSEIQCNRKVEKRNDWMNSGIFIVVSVFIVYYLPAFPLALPDWIFSLQYECDKEDRANIRRRNLRNGYEPITTASGMEGVTSELTRYQEEGTGVSEIPVDDSTPVTCWALLEACIQKLPDSRLSFNIKLAVLLFCIFPCVLYVQIGLWLTLKKKYIHESFKKKVPLPDQ